MRGFTQLWAIPAALGVSTWSQSTPFEAHGLAPLECVDLNSSNAEVPGERQWLLELPSDHDYFELIGSFNYGIHSAPLRPRTRGTRRAPPAHSF